MVAEVEPQSFAQAVQAAMERGAPLNERLAMVAGALSHFAPEQAEAVEQLVVRLKGHHAGALAPGVGEMMPGFVLPDENGTIVRLGELLRQGPLVINFHRGHWCPYCRLSSASVAEIQDEVLAAGGRLVAIVPERASFSRQMKATAKARFPFLTDAANGYALSLNLAVWVGLEMESLLTGAGIELPRYQGNAAWFLPIPATFVVNSDGTVAMRRVDPDHRQRMEVDDLLASVRQAH